jgi:hypothetical protein
MPKETPRRFVRTLNEGPEKSGIRLINERFAARRPAFEICDTLYIIKAENIHRGIDGLQKNISSTPWTQIPMTAKTLRINELLFYPKRKSFQELPYAMAYLKKCKGKKDATYGDTKR